MLFLSGRAHQDIQTAIAFFTSRVKTPDEDDWGKLKRVLKYLKATMSLGLTWFVDASYAVYADCKGHTSAIMTFGNGAVTSFSQKQKINTKSSTEAELIGVDDALPHMLWALYVIEAQGYTVKKNELLQDNQSAIKLEENGRASSS